MCILSDDEIEKHNANFKPFAPDKKLPVHLDTRNCHEPEKLINQLVLAVEAGLLLRGLTAAILDPLALKGDKDKYRTRYAEIEQQMKSAILKAKQG